MSKQNRKLKKIFSFCYIIEKTMLQLISYTVCKYRKYKAYI